MLTIAYALPDQKELTIVHIVVKQVIIFFGLPEGLLADQGTNLLLHLMKDLCELLLRVTTLNTTTYHLQCNSVVKRLNRTLKTMLRKHASRFRNEWDN